MLAWWAEYRVSRNYQLPTGKLMQSELQPGPCWWGPFHCRDCADVCANFGKTEQQAYEFNHGTADEKFCTFLVA
jgi:hypothetical protein